MGVRHEAPVVRGYSPYQLHHGLLGGEQDNIENHRADHIEPEMNQRGPLSVFFAREGCQQRGGAGPDVASQDDVERDGEGQEVLIGQKQHDADSHRGALDDGGEEQP